MFLPLIEFSNRERTMMPHSMFSFVWVCLRVLFYIGKVLFFLCFDCLMSEFDWMIWVSSTRFVELEHSLPCLTCVSFIFNLISV